MLIRNRVLALMADGQKRSLRTIAYKLEIGKESLRKLVWCGELVRVGVLPREPFQIGENRIPIVVRREFAHLHGVTKLPPLRRLPPRRPRARREGQAGLDSLASSGTTE
jgi:hypothetical protein